MGWFSCIDTKVQCMGSAKSSMCTPSPPLGTMGDRAGEHLRYERGWWRGNWQGTVAIGEIPWDGHAEKADVVLSLYIPRFSMLIIQHQISLYIITP